MEFEQRVNTLTKTKRIQAILGRVLPFIDPVIERESINVMAYDYGCEWVTQITTIRKSGRMIVERKIPHYLRNTIYVPSDEWPSLEARIPDFTTTEEEQAWKSAIQDQFEISPPPPLKNR